MLHHTFRAFRHRDYRIFWVGLFCGHTGTLIQSTAQAWLIYELTDSTFYLGLDGLCLGVPRSEEHTSELQSRLHLLCPLLLEKKKNALHGTSCCTIHLWSSPPINASTIP